jgi:hypothetical protein
MECKKCGKIIDQRTERKFCSGCGAIIGEEKPAPVIAGRGREEKRGSKYVSQRAVELDGRTRFFYVAWLIAFFVLYFAFQFSIIPYVFIAILAAIPCGALIAVLGVIVFSRMKTDLKYSFNDTFGFVPAGGPGRGLIESLASMLPLMAKLPPDTSKQPDNKAKK